MAPASARLPDAGHGGVLRDSGLEAGQDWDYSFGRPFPDGGATHYVAL